MWSTWNRIKCRQAAAWMDAALDEGRESSLSPGSRARLEAHLAACPGCRGQWEALRAADVALRAPRPVAAPEGMLADFRQRLAQEQVVAAARPARGFAPWLWPAGSLAAGIAAALMVGLGLGQPVVVPSVGVASSVVRDSSPAASARTSPGGAPRARTGPSRKPTRAGEELFAWNPLPAPGSRPRPKAPAPAAPAPALPRAVAPESSAYFKKEAPLAEVAVSRKDAPPVGDPLARRMEAQQAPLAVQPAEPDVASRAPSGPALARVAQASKKAGPEVMALQVQDQAPDLNVSPAVLTALQRQVDLQVDDAPLRIAARRLAADADVVLQVDAGVPAVKVSVDARGPLWQVLQSVAQQGHLQIYPEENQIVLRRVEAAAPRRSEPAANAQALQAPALPRGRASAASGAAMSKAAPPRPDAAAPAPSAPAGGAGPGTALKAKGARDVGLGDERALDLAVWPAEEWGTLPERGFELPKPEDLPAYGAAVQNDLEHGGPRGNPYGYGVNQAPQGQVPQGQAAPARQRGYLQQQMRKRP